MIKTQIDGLILTKPSLDDLPRIIKAANNIKIHDNMRDEFPHPFTEKNGIEYIDNYRKSTFSFSIKKSDVFIGDIHLSLQTDILRYSASLGYWLDEDYWGKGYMTASVVALCNYAFSKIKINRIFARLFSTNSASIKVLEKCGFLREGTFEKAIFKNDIFIDQVQYALVNQEFRLTTAST